MQLKSPENINFRDFLLIQNEISCQHKIQLNNFLRNIVF